MGQTIILKTSLNSNIDPQKFEMALENYKKSNIMHGVLDDNKNEKIVQTALDTDFNFEFNPRMIQDEDGNYDITSIDLSIKI